jgi:hypothetical protein
VKAYRIVQRGGRHSVVIIQALFLLMRPSMAGILIIAAVFGAGIASGYYARSRVSKRRRELYGKERGSPNG